MNKREIKICICSVLRIRDVYPGSWFFVHPGSRIQKQYRNKREGWKIFCYPTFFCSHKNHKIGNYINIWTGEEKNLGQFTKNYRTFYPKNCH